MLLFVLVLALSAAAQDQVEIEPTPSYEPIEPVSPPPSDTPVPTLAVTDIPTVPIEYPSITETPSGTLEDITLTPTATTILEEPPTYSGIPTLSPVSDESQSAVRAEPDSSLLFYEDFTTGVPLDMRFTGRGIAIVPDTDLGLALILTLPGEITTIQFPAPPDVVAEARFRLRGGSARIYARLSNQESYNVQLSADGTVLLYRSGELLASSVTTPGDDRRLRLSLFGNSIRVSVDRTEVLAFLDERPLSYGMIGLSASDFGEPGVLADEIAIWTAASSVSTSSTSPSLLSASPTPIFLSTPEGMTNYETVFSSNYEAFYGIASATSFYPPIHFIDRKGLEQQIDLYAATSPSPWVFTSDLAISPDGRWSAVDCSQNGAVGYSDICVCVPKVLTTYNPFVPNNNPMLITDLVEYLTQSFTLYPYVAPNCSLLIDESRDPNRQTALCDLTDLYNEQFYTPISHPGFAP